MRFTLKKVTRSDLCRDLMAAQNSGSATGLYGFVTLV